MKTKDYEKLQLLESKATEKLIKYINNQEEIKYIYDRMLGLYPFLQEESSKLPFNIWLCCDYRDKDNMTFAERLILEDMSMSPEEIEILREKTASYVSLFQIRSFEEPYVIVTDVLTQEDHRLLEPQVSYVLKEDDYLLSRLGTVLGKSRMIGEVSFVPKSVIHSFIRILLKDFNKLDENKRFEGAKSYLKNDALKIYDLFYQSAYKYFDPESEDLIPIYQELDEFEEYLSTKKSSAEIEKHLTNMIELYEYYLSEEAYSFKDLDKISVRDMLSDAIYEKFVTSGLIFNSYVSTLKAYLGYKSKISNRYQEANDEILEISKERFHYLKEILKRNTMAQGDPLLSLQMKEYESDSISSYINDFDRFLLYIFDNPLQLTEKKQHIKKADQNNVIDFLEKEYLLFFSRPGQMKEPVIHFFFNMGLRLKILKIRKNILSVTGNASEYLSMSKEDKLTLHLRGFWSQDTMKELLQVDSRKSRQIMKILLQSVKKLEEGPVTRENLPIMEDIDRDDLYLLIRYMTFMGILSNEGFNRLISFTSAGRVIAPHLDEWSKPRKNKVINIGQYTKRNKEEGYGESKTGGLDEI
ncbi:hypothetical protein [Gudongella sp. DL1XJH-153]|uniref:hypothetical protein n=1 Tax=Gudongella sp. DL1XJH-153 TaxID=3409804 RepID=UPI003BB7D837